MSKKRVSITDMLAASNQAEGTGLGIRCPKCHCPQFSDGRNVRNTIRIEGAIRRYRVCRTCGHIWTTHES